MKKTDPHRLTLITQYQAAHENLDRLLTNVDWTSDAEAARAKRDAIAAERRVISFCATELGLVAA